MEQIRNSSAMSLKLGRIHRVRCLSRKIISETSDVGQHQRYIFYLVKIRNYTLVRASKPEHIVERY